MDNEVLKYRSTLAYNREVFLIEHGAIVKAFSDIDQNFMELVEYPRTMRDAQGNSYVSLMCFLLLLQRQSRAAFESFVCNQSYLAWVLLRPGVEAVLLIGKFLDDPKFPLIWKNRGQVPKGYRSAFSGKGLRSVSLEGSDKIQGVLSRINDDFVHTNIDYYRRHLGVEAGDPEYTMVRLDFFDKDELNEANALAFLHLLLAMQASLSVLIAKLFETDVLLKGQLDQFLKDFGSRITTLALRSEEAKSIFSGLGMVTLENLRVT